MPNPFRAGLLILYVASLAASTAAAADEAAVDFAAEVKPILASKCWNCHGPDEQTREADLRLDRREDAAGVLEAEGDTPAALLERITATDPDLQMPPPSTKKPFSQHERQLLTRWIEQGAVYEQHWAFQSPRRSDPPSLPDSTGGRNPIDRFVIARLQAENLQPSPAADRTTLLRRLSFDLTGLPPSIEQVEAFLADRSADAYEKQIDRLLDSPRYGEHMAVPWLDAARYADTDGYQNDRYRYMHVWRDWVVLSLNENKPYDQFIVEQLAGDMLPDATLKQQVATGFCRNHRINSEDGSIPREWHVENVVDRVDTLGTAILGLTVACARCHDHKYDPLSAKEYYQLFAYFNNVPEWGVGPNNGNSPPFIPVPESWPDLAAEENVAVVPEPLKLRRARETKGNGLQRPQPGGPQTVMVMQEMPTPRPTYLLTRGQFDLPDKSQPLQPGVPAALDGFRDASSEPSLPGNRLGLARWLVDPRHPLTARVAVNRMWQQFFGVGLVKTSENFGLQGELPSHPELLDWLAVEFVESGWDVKALQKLILMSDTYRQSSRTTPELASRDPENRLLARGPRFRLHPFALRDAALASSGLLVERIGGPPAKPYMPPKIWRSISNNTYKQDQGEQLYRRSLYTFWRRTIPPPTMVNFNAAEREVCVVRKGQTNTPLQALTLMNNVTFVEAARQLAAEMLRHADEPSAAIEFGFRRLLARRPSSAEAALLNDAHAAFAAKYDNQPAAAEKLLDIGETPRDAALDPSQHAAMTMTASLMMNLDEAITKE
ncbi:PSD1 and planctomycete cytochrome C domain-containing protein [Roseimaritima ulvae]|uniref:Planctomycete cytochrome C n=1 Tax=Roseimaritima ulvae TaxID=980254 RepID=A0A5B9QKW0_9BACT|nr:PSD1 and planctomycete cytochrome C domain-containing protein [Roseimaritima ulvae]QEG38629.1 Planctomycete cytochrome C [Roseimaritima ulvae]